MVAQGLYRDPVLGCRTCRLDGIASAAGIALADLDIQVITVPVLRLDLAADRRNLAETVDRLRPRLLILDPFVRLHRIDENASGEVAPLLAYLRELQRRYGVAVLVVHHAKKGGAGVRAGQALRGSSEFHAWGDSNLYLRRDCDELSLTVEHRAAPSPRPLIIELAQQGLALALEVVERAKPVAAASPSLDERITTVLAEAQEALPFADLRAKCRVRAATLHERIGLLATAGRIVKTAALPIRLSPTATSGSVRPCSWTFTSVAIFGSHNRSQSSSDFFPTTRPAPPTWRRLAGATGLFAPIVRRRESRSASQIVLASCAAASAAVTPD